MSENQNLFAVLIDGDNAQSALIQQILKKVGEYGKPIIRRVYANKSSMQQWELPINEYSLKAKWVPNNTPRKNASDIALVIDAMDLLYHRTDLTGFFIVSSDSDFAELAKYIGTKNKDVFGIGEEKTPKSFQKACTRFFLLEELNSSPHSTNNINVTPAISSQSDHNFEDALIKAYEQAIVSNSSIDGWINIRQIYEFIANGDNDFQARDYRDIRVMVKQIMDLSQHQPDIFAIREIPDIKPVSHHMCILQDAPLYRFYKAYKKSGEERMLKDAEGWVLLSAIGDELSAMGQQLRVYKGKRYSTSLKAVQKMIEDYPNVIELTWNGEHPHVRVKN